MKYLIVSFSTLLLIFAGFICGICILGCKDTTDPNYVALRVLKVLLNIFLSFVKLVFTKKIYLCRKILLHEYKGEVGRTIEKTDNKEDT